MSQRKYGLAVAKYDFPEAVKQNGEYGPKYRSHSLHCSRIHFCFTEPELSSSLDVCRVNLLSKQEFPISFSFFY